MGVMCKFFEFFVDVLTNIMKKNIKLSGGIEIMEMEEYIDFNELNINDLHDGLFLSFDRHKDVKKCYRKENGSWVVKNIEYTETWTKKELEELPAELAVTINEGGFVFGAYCDEKLIGLAVLLNKKFGSKNQYIQLAEMSVSFGYRNKGIGKKLYKLCIAKAKSIGIKKIYISADPAEETQRFYLNIGCTDAIEINKIIASEQPYDRQMEYIV